MTRHVPRRFLLVAALAAAAVTLGLVAPAPLAAALGGGPSSAKDRIAADPPPVLFDADQVGGTADDVAGQRARAVGLVQEWAGTHGASPQDDLFIAWLERRFPAPPPGLAGQMPEVVALASTRTPAGTSAATWLEVHGKKDVWKLYAHDQGEMLPSAARTDRKDEEKALLTLTKQVSDDLGTAYGSSAPYVVEPSLRTDHTVAPGQRCPCSYPSRHASAAAASRTYLGALDPVREPEYAAMEAQVDFSRVYMAGHFPGDVTAGALLGDAMGDYWLLTRRGVDPADLG